MRANSLTWNWSDAVRSAICVLPASLVILWSDPTKGLAWAIGILPAAMIGMAPTRRARSKLLVVGLLFGGSVLLGSILSRAAILAVVGIFLVAFASALLASRRAFGQIAMALCAPITAIGLSYPELEKALGIALLMVAGSTWSYLVFMCWPEVRPPDSAESLPLLPRGIARRYGILLGLAAASAAAVGEAIHTDHVGWATAAALFVMRPRAEMQQLRSVGRVVSVFLGALAAVVFLRASPPSGAVAIAAIAAITGMGAMHKSRWYVTPFFTTFMVLTLLLYADATVANEQWRFNERVGETLLGVGLAYFYGLIVPVALDRLVKRRHGGSEPVTDGSLD